MFKKILIANRGEIAVRICKTCHDLGIAVVAVYSDADKNALHVQKADEAYHIGAPPVSKSYLNMAKILEVAKECNAEAIHPGYGLLSENPHFARKCQENGIAFIGPSSESIKVMGDKLTARNLLEAKGIPVVPGYSKPIKDADEAEEIAQVIGYPVMLKASAGGGGIGMSIVEKSADMAEIFKECAWRSKASFGNDTLYMEKLVVKPRHIEMQILGDGKGEAVHLFERECSVQRRHQKVIEEAPSPLVNTGLREKLINSALNTARAVNYKNAGTIEFIVGEDREPYFLEMNTRLQVEHPITEMITGRDLVAEQLRIACGESLSFKQEEAAFQGWAMECRLYAEDPETLRPSPGKITALTLPQDKDLRIDHGLLAGYKVSAFYDPLLAKVITWGETREESRQKMILSLQEINIEGIKTNIPLLLKILANPDFKTGNYDTSLIANLGEAI